MIVVLNFVYAIEIWCSLLTERRLGYYWSSLDNSIAMNKKRLLFSGKNILRNLQIRKVCQTVYELFTGAAFLSWLYKCNHNSRNLPKCLAMCSYKCMYMYRTLFFQNFRQRRSNLRSKCVLQWILLMYFCLTSSWKVQSYKTFTKIITRYNNYIFVMWHACKYCNRVIKSLCIANFQYSNAHDNLLVSLCTCWLLREWRNNETYSVSPLLYKRAESTSLELEISFDSLQG